jgi:nitroimidazol reductase NimA-like FMN-containing flavoprotein (pyridoxamine 5'-phosphate oxidase superfamily)
VLQLDVPCHLGTIDGDGFPVVTPIWFVWADGGFHLSCLPHRPQLSRLRRDPRAFIAVDFEAAVPQDGRRPNWQVKGRGIAEIYRDDDNRWTNAIGPVDRASMTSGRQRRLKGVGDRSQTVASRVTGQTSAYVGGVQA